LGKDITKLYNETKNYEIQAFTDELTGLHNRKIFNRLDFKDTDFFIYIDLVDMHENELNLKEKIKHIKFKFNQIFGNYVNLGFSYGYHRYSENIENTLNLVDKLMYQDKENKRNIKV